MSFFFRYKWHFLVWAVYFVFWTALSVNGYHTPFFLALTITLGWAIGQGTLAYFCIYRLLPLYFYPRRYGSFALILLVDIGVSALFLRCGFRIFRHGRSVFHLYRDRNKIHPRPGKQRSPDAIAGKRKDRERAS